jgi:outer membrane protein assembly factor BamB
MLLAMCFSTHADAQSSWPTFRGADRSGVASDEGLLNEWPNGGPELLWTAEGAGQGYASVSIADGKVFTLGDGITENDKSEYLTCFDQSNGKLIWKLKTGNPWTAGRPSWHGSRSTPTIDEDRVYVITPEGVLYCVSTEGKKKWKVDLKKKFKGKKAEMWGYSESVLIDGDNLICTPGGDRNTVVALNKMTGKKVWSCKRENDRGAGHASIVISNVGDTKVYVQTTGSGAMGVRASDGELMWTYDIDKTTAVIPTPIVRDDLVFFSAGYNRGGALLRQVPEGDEVAVEEIYPLQQGLNNKHGGIVLVGDHLYGDTNDKGTPFCADLMTGKVLWKSRGSGQKSACVTAADGKLFFQYANGTMTMVKANSESFEELGSFKIPGDTDRPSWAHPVILDGKMYVRTGTNIHCYAVK